jgi:hypothetical protein
MSNEYFAVIKHMADHHNAETRRQVQKLRQAYGPGTVQEVWLSQGGRRLAGLVGHLLMGLGQSLQAFSQGREIKAEGV